MRLYIAENPASGAPWRQCCPAPNASRKDLFKLAKAPVLPGVLVIY